MMCCALEGNWHGLEKNKKKGENVQPHKIEIGLDPMKEKGKQVEHALMGGMGAPHSKVNGGCTFSKGVLQLGTSVTC